MTALIVFSSFSVIGHGYALPTATPTNVRLTGFSACTNRAGNGCPASWNLRSLVRPR
jgi:hypothetical protein